jgi:hypothetical protein
VRRVRRRDELLGLGSAVASGARCSGFGRAVKLDAKLWCAASARRGVEDGRQLSNGVLSAHGKERGVRAAPSSKEQRFKVSSWPTRAQQVVE